MNQGRISRNYRLNRRGPAGPASVTRMNFCLRCLKFGHYRQTCRNDPIVSCGKCFRAYFFGTECVCGQTDRDGMTLRLVGGQRLPRPCMDITIGFNTYGAFVNQSTSQTTINLEVLSHLNSLREQINLQPVDHGFIEATIKRRNKQVTLNLEIKQDQEDPVILGNDFMMESGFQLTVDGITINERSPFIENSSFIDFIYNFDQGRSLRQWFQQNNLPMYNRYLKGEEPTLQDEPRVMIVNEPMQPEHDENNEVEDEAANDADVLQLHPDPEDLDDI